MKEDIFNLFHIIMDENIYGTNRRNILDKSIYNTYAWTIDYFHTVKREQNKSAAEQWLSDQFTLFVVENMPPIVDPFTLRWNVEYSLSWEHVKVFAVVHLIIKDVGRIHNITIWSLDNAEVFWVD